MKKVSHQLSSEAGPFINYNLRPRAHNNFNEELLE